MITVIMNREKEGERFDQGSREVSVNDALGLLVTCELAWGGNIIEASETSITVMTQVLGCLDKSMFSGTKEEMRPLVEIAYYYLKATEHKLAVDGALVLANLKLGKDVGNPLILSIAAPLLMGGSRLKLATMLGCGITEKDELEAGLKLQLKDLVAAIQMKYEGVVGSFKEAFALAA